MLNLYVLVSLKGKEVLVHVTSEAHVVDNLWANILVGVDLLTPARFVMDLAAR
jgi:hypothetical protein